MLGCFSFFKENLNIIKLSFVLDYFVSTNIFIQATVVWKDASSLAGERNSELVPDYLVVTYWAGVCLGSSR